MTHNVVVLLLDTARADHLSCYGYDRETSPFIDSLADRGVRYENAYSNSIWSLPAYGSLFTGTLPSEHGAVDWTQRIESNVLTRRMNDAGVSTHVTSPHLVSGQYGIADEFDTSTWVKESTRSLPFDNDPVAQRVKERLAAGGWDSRLAQAWDVLRWTIEERSFQTVPNSIYYLHRLFKRSRGWWDDDGAEDTLAAAREVVATTDEPFFLFTNFVEPHGPYRPPKGYIREFVDDDVSIAEINYITDINPLDLMFGDATLTPREEQILIDLYDAEIRYLDSQLEQFYEFLVKKGVADDTLFVVCADHGELFGEGGMWNHQGRIHRDLCRVPLVLSHPDLEPKVEDGVVQLKSLCEYLPSIAGTDEPITPLPAEGEAVIEYYGLDTHLSIDPWEVYDAASEAEWGRYQLSLVTDEYRLYWDANGTVELYRTDADLATTEDLSAAEPETVARLQDRIRVVADEPERLHRAYRESMSGGVEDIDDEMQARLEDLGYF